MNERGIGDRSQSKGNTASLHEQTFDYVLVGGGLQNALIAMALLTRRPHARVAVVERHSTLGGNHIWCFHADDVTGPARRFVAPLIAHHWNGYSVHFPGWSRTLDTPYSAVTSERLHQVVSQQMTRSPHSTLITGVAAASVQRNSVALEDGRRLRARAVIDARGPDPGMAGAHTGYQTFLGQELELARDHELTRPVLMDATVAQHSGFRFFYLLPLAPRRLLVEETFFTDTPEVDVPHLRRSIRTYAAGRGYQVQAVAREETGVLPMPWRWSHSPQRQGPLVAGYAGGFFHPGTGYSFPVAARLAEYVSGTAPDELFGPGLAALIAAQRRQRAFCHALNKMLFGWFPAPQRYRVIERFYRLPQGVIRRFYALSLTRGDRARILIGRPPKGMSWRAALGSLLASRRMS